MTNMMKAMDLLENDSCRGCGARFQFEDDTKEGYIPINEFMNSADKLESKEALEEGLEMQLLNKNVDDSDLQEGPFSQEEYSNDLDLDLPYKSLIQEMEDGLKMRNVICDRCQKITKGDYEEIKKIIPEIEGNAI